MFEPQLLSVIFLFSYFFFFKTVVHQCYSIFSTIPRGSQTHTLLQLWEQKLNRINVYWVSILLPSPTPNFCLLLVISAKGFFALLPTESFLHCSSAKVFKLMSIHQVLMVSPKAHFPYTQNIILYIFWCKGFWEFWICDSSTLSGHVLKIKYLERMQVFTRTKCKGQGVDSGKEGWLTVNTVSKEVWIPNRKKKSSEWHLKINMIMCSLCCYKVMVQCLMLEDRSEFQLTKFVFSCE